jgi:hypothetical protein
VSRVSRVQRISERLIRAACRRLSEDTRADRCREWAAELPAILDDQSIRPSIRRAVRALIYSAGIARTTRRLSRADGRARPMRSAQWRNGAMDARPPDVAVRATVGLAVYLVLIFLVISLLRAFPDLEGWPLRLGLGLAAAFDACCIANVARADRVRYLPKWVWALICLVQTPLGGIIYLSVGRVRRVPPVPPGSVPPRSIPPGSMPPRSAFRR